MPEGLWQTIARTLDERTPLDEMGASEKAAWVQALQETERQSLHDLVDVTCLGFVPDARPCAICGHIELCPTRKVGLCAECVAKFGDSTTGRIYFAALPDVRYGGIVKIGYTTQPIPKRMWQLGSLACIRAESGGRRREAELHRQFAEYHKANEWFRVEGRLANYLGIEPAGEEQD